LFAIAAVATREGIVKDVDDGITESGVKLIFGEIHEELGQRRVRKWGKERGWVEKGLEQN
jgi:hypothetical protein